MRTPHYLLSLLYTLSSIHIASANTSGRLHAIRDASYVDLAAITVSPDNGTMCTCNVDVAGTHTTTSTSTTLALSLGNGTTCTPEPTLSSATTSPTNQPICEPVSEPYTTTYTSVLTKTTIAINGATAMSPLSAGSPSANQTVQTEKPLWPPTGTVTQCELCHSSTAAASDSPCNASSYHSSHSTILGFAYPTTSPMIYYNSHAPGPKSSVRCRLGLVMFGSLAWLKVML